MDAGGNTPFLTLEMGAEHLPPKLHAAVTKIGQVRGAPTAQGPEERKEEKN